MSGTAAGTGHALVVGGAEPEEEEVKKGVEGGERRRQEGGEDRGGAERGRGGESWGATYRVCCPLDSATCLLGGQLASPCTLSLTGSSPSHEAEVSNGQLLCHACFPTSPQRPPLCSLVPQNSLPSRLIIIIIRLPFVSPGSPAPLRQEAVQSRLPQGAHVSLFVAGKVSRLLGNVRE